MAQEEVVGPDERPAAGDPRRGLRPAVAGGDGMGRPGPTAGERDRGEQGEVGRDHRDQLRRTARLLREGTAGGRPGGVSRPESRCHAYGVAAYAMAARSARSRMPRSIFWLIERARGRDRLDEERRPPVGVGEALAGDEPGREVRVAAQDERPREVVGRGLRVARHGGRRRGARVSARVRPRRRRARPAGGGGRGRRPRGAATPRRWRPHCAAGSRRGSRDGRSCRSRRGRRRAARPRARRPRAAPRW